MCCTVFVRVSACARLTASSQQDHSFLEESWGALVLANRLAFGHDAVSKIIQVGRAWAGVLTQMSIFMLLHSSW